LIANKPTTGSLLLLSLLLLQPSGS